MSYCYFLFIFSWYVKPNLISEKFEAIFVKHFLPWNLTPSKHCSSQIGPVTPKKILRGAFSMPKSNSKHTRKWWDSFLLFWLGANRLPLTCVVYMALQSMFWLIETVKGFTRLLPVHFVIQFPRIYACINSNIPFRTHCPKLNMIEEK